MYFLSSLEQISLETLSTEEMRASLLLFLVSPLLTTACPEGWRDAGLVDMVSISPLNLTSHVPAQGCLLFQTEAHISQEDALVFCQAVRLVTL